MNVTYDFHGKAAFVTGAASGIGRTTALAFARAGAHVALVDRSADGLRETARLIEADGGQALTLTCDVTSEEDVQTAVDRTLEQFGSLDAAFNNPGVEQPVQSAADTAKDDWDRILGVSLTGAFLCTRAQVRQMLRQDGGGAIVNVSSGAGVKGSGPGRLRRRQARDRRLYPLRRPRPRRRQRPHQRCLPRHHRHRDDPPLRRNPPRRP
ncbi:SDR family NAD(P)-dependent oxidoreductase [Streptomyces sp. NPDC058293]|uniref:SDR family NAD(P)-dependent oxidoreductase n=1 Tax=Streptomyces sp. NPDC058293 TaxID=3346429 RepID=UPI0036EDD0D8